MMTVAAERPLRVGLVDDHLLFRKGIVAVLKPFTDLELVLEAAHGQQLIDQLAPPSTFALDAVLLDLEMPHLDGLGTTRWLLQHRPEIRIIILSMHGEESLIINLIQEGVHGYLLKNAHPEEVARAIRQVCDQGHYFSEYITRLMQKQLQFRNHVQRAVRQEQGIDLTATDREILLLVARGLTSAEIGEHLHMSPRTVEGRRKRLMDRFGVRSTPELIKLATRQGWI